ncbi:phosphotransferase [Vibrio japonicus]|uniref:Phosphotransferase n=1 Tax=Vibrio japonicus TaxID=1824638 RepID=A0ABY5LI62_9VIBR|nr:phosphotransferase [Vibrio japonicus]UUM31516.1 phosphotransferase [Vibrio japonicus]
MARMSWYEACQLDRSLMSLDHFFSRPPEYALTLTGGLTNRCWKIVASNGDAFVWRPTTPITKAFSISRHQEHQILSAISESKISPLPIFINDQGLLVEWIEGHALTHDLSFDSLLETMVRIHELDTRRIPVAPFNFTARVDHYWMMLREEFKHAPYDEVYQTWRKAPSLADVGVVLCHFDLAGYNMVGTPQGNKVIDWEYAVIGDPRLDLTLSIDVLGEDPIKSVHQYCQVRGIEGVDDWVEGVMAWRPRATMMAMLWYLLAYQLWGDEQYLTQAQNTADTFCS